MKALLSKPATLFFLFAFNAVVAVLAALFIDGSQGIGTAIGMGVVSLGAGAALLSQRKKSRREWTPFA